MDQNIHWGIHSLSYKFIELQIHWAKYSICGETRGGSALTIFDYFWGSMKAWGWGLRDTRGVKLSTPRQIEHWLNYRFIEQHIFYWATPSLLSNTFFIEQHLLYWATHSLLSNTFFIEQHILYLATHLYWATHSLLSNTFFIEQHILYWATHSLLSNTFYIEQHIFYIEQHLLYWATHSLLSNTFFIEQHILYWATHSILSNTYSILNNTFFIEQHILYWATHSLLSNTFFIEQHILYELSICQYYVHSRKITMATSKSFSSTASNIWNSCQIICSPFKLFMLLEDLSSITYSCLLTLTEVQNLVRSNQSNVSHFVIQHIYITAIAQPGNTMPPIWRRSIWAEVINFAYTYGRMCKSCVIYLLTICVSPFFKESHNALALTVECWIWIEFISKSHSYFQCHSCWYLWCHVTDERVCVCVSERGLLDVGINLQPPSPKLEVRIESRWHCRCLFSEAKKSF